jgi:hypothetical protein
VRTLHVMDLAREPDVMAAIVALEDCTIACLDCARRIRLASVADVDRMSRGIATCRACADVCDATVQVLRDAPVSRLEIVVAQVRSASEATRTCAVECAEYTEDHCQRCTDMCATARVHVNRLLVLLEAGLSTDSDPS